MAEHNLNYDDDPNKPVLIKNTALCFTACKWGQGEQGYQLFENLLLTLSSSREKPRYLIIFWMQQFFCVLMNVWLRVLTVYET